MSATVAMAAAVVLSLNLVSAFAFVVTPVNPKPRLQLRSLSGTTFVQPDQRCVHGMRLVGEFVAVHKCVLRPFLFSCVVHVVEDKHQLQL